MSGHPRRCPLFYMHTLIARLLRKRGIESIEELDVEEKKTFETWQGVLSEGELSTDKIKEFCQSQLEQIEARWQDYTIDNDKKAQLIPYHAVYSTLLKVIVSPIAGREALERQLEQLIQ